jgi:tRNA threonylcarbamoyladenosine biosynthesis protein TsaB
MTILGFDTATPATTVALWDPIRGLALEDRDDPPPGAKPRHTGRLLALIVALLERGAIGWGELERIAVGVGPGTFTGLRIGIATARALGQARAVPLVGISTLESLALGARSVPGQADTVFAVLDARRGEVFAAGWRVQDVGDALVTASEARPATPTLAPSALAPEALAEVVPTLAAPSLALGDGAIKFRMVLERSGASVPRDDSQLHRVTAVNHCRLAGNRAVNAPDQIRPAYLRLPDAELTRRAPPSR